MTTEFNTIRDHLPVEKGESAWEYNDYCALTTDQLSELLRQSVTSAQLKAKFQRLHSSGQQGE
jgi:hypothetical protein